MFTEETKSLAALYSEINKKLDNQNNQLITEVIQNIRAKISLLKGVWLAYQDISKIGPEYTAHDSVMYVEKKIMDSLKKAGIDINITVDPMLNTELLNQKGLLVFINHQGGGLETFISRSLINSVSDKPCHWLLKDDLMKIPFYKDVLAVHEPIVIERNQDNFGMDTMKHYGKEIAEKLKEGHNVVMSFEGTRSQDGEIVKKHEKLASVFKLFIKQNISENDFNQLLITVDTFSTMPEPIEKNPFGKIRSQSKVNAYIQELPHSTPLSTKNNNNIFEISENTLRKMLIEKLNNITAGNGK